MLKIKKNILFFFVILFFSSTYCSAQNWGTQPLKGDCSFIICPPNQKLEKQSDGSCNCVADNRPNADSFTATPISNASEKSVPEAKECEECEVSCDPEHPSYSIFYCGIITIIEKYIGD